jgi:hypothetical protein
MLTTLRPTLSRVALLRALGTVRTNSLTEPVAVSEKKVLPLTK